MNHVSRLSLITILLALAGCTDQASPAIDDTPAPVAPTAQPTNAEDGFAVADDPAKLAAGGLCALDSIDGVPVESAVLAVGDRVVFSGWMGLEDGAIPTDAKLVLASPDTFHAVPAVAGVERPDVADALGLPGLGQSGFQIPVALEVPPGSYRAYIVHGEASPTACALQGTIVVGG